MEVQGDRNLAAHGVVAVPAASVLPQESTTPGRRHSRASSLPTLKLKRGKSKIKGEQEVKRRQKGAFRAPFMQLASRPTSQGS